MNSAFQDTIWYKVGLPVSVVVSSPIIADVFQPNSGPAVHLHAPLMMPDRAFLKTLIRVDFFSAGKSELVRTQFGHLHDCPIVPIRRTFEDYCSLEYTISCPNDQIQHLTSCSSPPPSPPSPFPSQLQSSPAPSPLLPRPSLTSCR